MESHSDRGSQYTGSDWITTLNMSDIKISIVGQGRYLDNIFVKRLLRFFKQKAAYLHEIIDQLQAKRIITGWIEFYNSKRP
ncbi:MAG: putative transposase [Octadecabacter sp.]|jgi:putative transposase